MACINCFDNCLPKVSDRCVQYTGDDIPILGVCKGDSLLQIEQIVLEKLQKALDGTGVEFADLTIDCDFITTLLDGEDKTLANLIQVLVNANCTLRELIQELSDEVNAVFNIDTSCLTLPEDPTRDDVLEAAITKLCAISTTVTNVSTDYVKATELCSMVNDCLSSSSASAQEYTKMPKYVPMAYFGPLTVFDSSGKGLAASGYDKVYICNGNNGTKDLRGRVLVGANTNVVGPALDSAVDPSLAQNAGYSIAVNTKVGTYTHTLTTTEMPAHTHTLTDPGHIHNFPGQKYSSHAQGGSGQEYRDPATQQTNSATTGITMASAGGSQPHNNTQPSYGVVYIIYLP